MAERSGGAVSTSGRISEEPNSGTIVFVGVQGDGIVGYLAFEDTLREDAAEVVSRLGKLGMKTMLLSGDRLNAVKGMAAKARISRIPL